jgi:phage terminase large subunit-like protein
MGLDLATKVDMAACIYLFRRAVGDVEHYYVFGRYYLPEAAITDGRNSQYSGWALSERLITTQGDVIDFDRIQSDIVGASSTYAVEQVGFDPWQGLS